MVAVAALWLAACSKEAPTAPKAEFLEAHDSLWLIAGIGDTIHIYFSDSTALSQYKLSLALAPGELKIDTTRTGIAWQEWTYLFIREITAPYADTSFILVPSALALPGKYRLIASALNHAFREGNDTLWLFLKNPADTVNPTISLSSPLPNAGFADNDTIKISGMMNDLATDNSPSGVYKVDVVLKNTATGNAISVHTASRVTNDTLRKNYTVSSGLADGNYFLIIRMTDGYNNRDSVIVPVIIQ